MRCYQERTIPYGALNGLDMHWNIKAFDVFHTPSHEVAIHPLLEAEGFLAQFQFM